MSLTIPIFSPLFGKKGYASPSSLFRANEQGVWYDPSDLTTLFQDAAGTIPVTAVEQPVGLMLDKSGRGNHAYQATSANRPTLSARYNLLTYSEDFSNAVWMKSRCGVSTNSTTDPSGLQTADTITEDTSTGSHEIGNYILHPANTPVTLKVFIKRSSGTRNIRLTIYSGADGARAFINIDTLSVTNESFGAATYISGSVTHVGDGWYLCSITGSVPNANPSFVFSMINTGGSTLYTGDGTSGLYFWGADARPSNHGTDLPPYQRVTTNTDYDTVGFPPYLAFNGTSSSMATNSIDFSATDKMSVWAGVRKLSDATTKSLFVFGTSGTEAGSFEWLFPPNPSSIRLECAYVGDSGVAGNYMQVDTEQAPASSVIHTSIVSNLRPYRGGVNIRYNGELKPSVQQNNVETSGNFGNFALTIGGRPTTLLFLGNIYSLIIRGAQSTDKQVSNAESWINKKIGKVY